MTESGDHVGGDRQADLGKATGHPPVKAQPRYYDKTFLALIENISDAIIATDEAGEICYTSPSIERVLGFLPDQVLGRNIFEFVNPEDAKSARTAFGNIIANPGVSGALTAVRAKHSDGSWRDVEALGKLLPEGDTVVLSVRDITARRLTEEALRQSENKLRLHVQQTRLAVIEWDAELRISGWNPAAEKIFGYTAVEVVGRDISFLITDDVQDFAKEIGVRTMGDLNSGPLTNHNVTRDGRIIICDWCNTPLTGSNGEVVGLISLVEDVTEQRRMQEHLLHAQRLEMIGTMASGIAHDLNNILTPIIVIGPTLRLEISSEMGLKKLDALETSAQRGLDLVHNILSFTRGLKVERTNVQSRQIFKEITQIIEEVFPKSIRLKVTVPEEPWLVHANPTELHQVLMNLCINAGDAMPRGGTLALEVRNVVLSRSQANCLPGAKPGPYVEWHVSDTGSGIPQEQLQRIFDPFFTTKERGKGTGLGLAIVQRVVRSHEGAIQVQSEVGRGTHFRVYFPICSNDRLRP